MKVQLTKDSMYPVFIVITTDYKDVEVELTEAEYRVVMDAERAYEKVQNFLRRKYGEVKV